MQLIRFLSKATTLGYKKVVETLAPKIKNINFEHQLKAFWDKKGKVNKYKESTLLENALENGHSEIADFLIKLGAELKFEPDVDNYRLNYFVSQLTIDGDVSCVELCLKHNIIKKEDLPRRWQESLAIPDISKKELYLEVGGGSKRWQVLFGQTPPHKALIKQSPFGFDLDKYKEFFPITQIIASIEKTTYLGNELNGPSRMIVGQEYALASKHAYKLSVLFGDMKNAGQFIDQFQNAESKQPIHDLLLFELPKNGQWDILEWRKLVLDKKHGKAMTNLLAFAPQIEKLLGRPPKDLEEAKNAAAKVSYERAGENLEFSKMCIDYFIEEEAFNRALDTKIKESCNLPDISIDGLAVEAPGYKMVKLPVGDMRGFILGKLTNCCQSIGGQGEACAMHLMSDPNAGAYIIIQERKGKPERIVAQSFAGISEDGKTLIFDSWERLGKTTDKYLDKFYPAFAFEAEKRGLEVTLGTGGNTPKGTGYDVVIQPKKMRGYNGYNDSDIQVTIPPREIAAVDASIHAEAEVKVDAGAARPALDEEKRARAGAGALGLEEKPMANLSFSPSTQHTASAKLADKYRIAPSKWLTDDQVGIGLSTI